MPMGSSSCAATPQSARQETPKPTKQMGKLTSKRRVSWLPAGLRQHTALTQRSHSAHTAASLLANPLLLRISGHCASPSLCSTGILQSEKVFKQVARNKSCCLHLLFHHSFRGSIFFAQTFVLRCLDVNRTNAAPRGAAGWAGSRDPAVTRMAVAFPSHRSLRTTASNKAATRTPHLLFGWFGLKQQKL